jgi:hypothetical protein
MRSTTIMKPFCMALLRSRPRQILAAAVLVEGLSLTSRTNYAIVTRQPLPQLSPMAMSAFSA